MSALRKLLAATIVALTNSDASQVDAVDRWLGCVAARGHSFDVDGRCSKCGARSSGQSVMDLAVEAEIRREGN